jgi:heme/copper-type cytochrome/quinol oxidase subunit 2
MGEAPPDKLGVVSGMLALTRTLGQSVGISVMGAFWAAMVFRYSDAVPGASATEASAAAQVAALQNTFMITAVITLFALLLAFWAMVKERRTKTTLQGLEKEPTT